MRTFLAVTLLVAAAAANGSQRQMLTFDPVAKEMVPVTMNFGAKIIGGVPANCTADYHEFPHAVAVQYTNFFCSGQLVDEEWVMTAGHCCDGTAAGGYTLTYGTHENWRSPDPVLDPYGGQVRVSAVYQHEDYLSSIIRNDACLLKLSSIVTMVPNHVQAAVLATEATSVAEDYTTLVYPCGWGKQCHEFSCGVSDQLIVTNDHVAPDDDCQAFFGIEDPASQICIDYPENQHGTCNGDSGGPLNSRNPAWESDPDNNYKWITQGITSYGSGGSQGCETANAYDVFTDVAFYNSAAGENWFWRTTNGKIGEAP